MNELAMPSFCFRATMVPNTVSFSHKIPLLTRRPISHFGRQTKIRSNPVQISGFSSCFSCNSYPFPLNSSHGLVIRHFVHSEVEFRQLGFKNIRISAVSNGGSGGTGGYGGSTGGNSDGKAESGGGSGRNWSLLSCCYVPELAIDQVPSLDMKRIFLFTLLGLVLVGPTLHFWYLYLSKLVTFPGASGAFLRLLLDQFLFSPIFIGVFLATLVTLEGRPLQVVPKLQQEWFSAVLANWQLWIPFQFLNFQFVPQKFQVLAANFIALVWNVILSYKAHKEVIAKQECS